MKTIIALAALVAVVSAGSFDSRLASSIRSRLSSTFLKANSFKPIVVSDASANIRRLHPETLFPFSTHAPPTPKPTQHVEHVTLAPAKSPVEFADPAPAFDAEQPITVVKEELHNNDGFSNYNFKYELSDGQNRDEVAEAVLVRDPKTNEEHIIYKVQGSYGFFDAKGNYHGVSYTADENGYKPVLQFVPFKPAFAKK
ncbi:uncharacterized protein LOC106636910 [Copidosoma floridanum]|uniref:uncharacterized protein LOC106636910 n=1 Tax=Copidosoma floridanum TaxID=29053 RepID=UPI0006C9C61C|nr:uncharacterized protein LOC106636910 [Copidosoma floridanum]